MYNKLYFNFLPLLNANWFAEKYWQWHETGQAVKVEKHLNLERSCRLARTFSNPWVYFWAELLCFFICIVCSRDELFVSFELRESGFWVEDDRGRRLVEWRKYPDKMVPNKIKHWIFARLIDPFTFLH